ncbi:cell division protein PerM [Corynebacterium auris]|uniref:cell division protein PerM n=1 Tax=Corynebacterium auris TaxID=44750 RepID=UPI0025B59D8C|nr:DUF6350 family protein [Corynebacterium auris]WJY67609.1 hypothetical protein CAURIS_03450 [Corynebacterium auris]
MSNKSSPRASSNRKERTRRKPVRASVPASTRRPEQPNAPTTLGRRLRQYLPSIVIPQLVIVLIVTVLCLAAIGGTGAPMAYLPGSIGSAWLAVHGAPLRYDGVTLGILPLLPVMGVIALLAARVRAAIRSRVSVADLFVLVSLTAATSLTLSAIALFMVGDASTVYPVELPPVAPALLTPLAVHGVAFAVGMGTVLWRALARRYKVPEFVVASAQSASRLLPVLLGAAGAAFLVCLAAGHERVGDLIEEFPVLSTGGAVAIGVLSLLYLPNAAAAALGVLMGGSFGYADAEASLFAVDNVAFPPLPLFGAIPGEAAAWAPALMLVPAAIVIYWAVSHVLRARASLLYVFATAAWLAAFCLVLTLLSGGAAGAYGWVGVNPGTFPLLAFAWVAVPGAIAWGVLRARQGGVDKQAEVEEPVGPEETGPEETPERDEPEVTEPEPEEAETEGTETEDEEEVKPEGGGSTKWVPPETQG